MLYYKYRFMSTKNVNLLFSNSIEYFSILSKVNSIIYHIQPFLTTRIAHIYLCAIFALLAKSSENHIVDAENISEIKQSITIFNEIEHINRYGYIRVNPNSKKWKEDIDKKQKEIIKQGVPFENIILEVCSIDYRKDIFTNLPLFKNLISRIDKKNTESILVMSSMNECSYSLTSFLWLNARLFQKNIYLVTLDLKYCESSITNRKMLENFAKIYQIHMADNLNPLNADKIIKKHGSNYDFTNSMSMMNRMFTKRIKKSIPIILELKDLGFSIREISDQVKISRTTVYKVLKFLKDNPNFLKITQGSLEDNESLRNPTSENSIEK